MKSHQPATLPCGQTIELLDRYVSGELDRDVALGIETHQATCAVCASFVEDRRRVRSALQTAASEDADAPEWLLGDTLDRLRATTTGPMRSQPTWRPLAMAAGLVLAATGAVSVAWMALGNHDASENRASVRLAADAEHHGKCVQEMAGRVPPPVQGGTRQDAAVATVESIVRAQAIGGMTITDAHRCTDGVRRYVHVVIEREGALAGVLVSDVGDRKAGGSEGLPVVATAREATFTTGASVVSVFSESPAIDASVFADRLRPAMATARRTGKGHGSDGSNGSRRI